MKTLYAAVLGGTLALAGVAAGFDSGFAPGVTTRVSVSSSGAPAIGTVMQSGVLSANGRYVAFVADAKNLVGAAGVHVYRHDRMTGATVLVTVAQNGSASAAGGAAPTLSADGRYVAFASLGDDFVVGDSNGAQDVFVRDMVNGTNALASASSAGVIGDMNSGLSGAAGAREISDDGHYVVFQSMATNLVTEPNNLRQQIYVKDLTTGALVRASVDALGAPGDQDSSQPTISGDGRVVAFRSEATNFSQLSTMVTSQVFVRDLAAGTTRLESVMTSGLPVATRVSASPALSVDGHYLAFESQAQLESRDLDNGFPGTWDVYLRDRVARTTVLASHSAKTTSGVDSRAPVISSDGRFVGFTSLDDMLVPLELGNRLIDVFLYDRITDGILMVSLNDAGLQANAGSFGPSVSSDGHLVLFNSSASNLVLLQTSTGQQLYVRDLASNHAPVVTVGANAALDEGVALSRWGSFTDEDASTSWTATVDWGDGSGSTLSLATDKSFTLSHLYSASVGTFVVTVHVTDEAGAIGEASFEVTVNNLAPTVDVGAAVDLAFDMALHRAGTFTDPGTTETYTATVDYGDGTPGPVALSLTGNSFQLDHVYALPGRYSVVVTVIDGNGGTGSARLLVTVLDYSYEWLDPVGEFFIVGRNLPVKFTVRAADGSIVLDTSVQVVVLDASGGAVAGPYLYGDQPSRSVVWNGTDYHVNVDTKEFSLGTYTLRVSFSSPTLTGEFSLMTNGTAGRSGLRATNR